MKRRTHTFIPVAYETSLVVQMVKKNLPAMQKTWFQFLGQEDPWRREWQPTSVFLPGKFHGQRTLAGYSPWDRKELDKNEQLNMYETCTKVDHILNHRTDLDKCKNKIKSCKVYCSISMETKKSVIIDNTKISKHMDSK